MPETTTNCDYWRLAWSVGGLSSGKEGRIVVEHISGHGSGGIRPCMDLYCTSFFAFVRLCWICMDRVWFSDRVTSSVTEEKKKKKGHI